MQITTYPRSTRSLRKAILLANGCFLALVGGAQMIFELLSDFGGIGPLGRIFAGSQYTIGFFEAHGLALLIGLLLICVAASDPKRFWHGFAACVHLLLGGANLLFWHSFVAWGLVPMGVVATAFHGLFLIAQLFFFVRTSTKLLLGLAKPSGGSATIFGKDSVRDSVAIREKVGYLAQNPRYYDHLTARETLRFTARFFYTGPKAAIEHRIAETLELVGLSDKADRPIKGFSGGERQRLGIAQAQVNEPDLLILDEPAAALDPMGRRDVLAVMERLRKHTTVFYSTHILEDVQRVSDSVAILNHGQLVAQAPIAELLNGSGGIQYSLSIRGAADAARARIASQPWVTAVVDNATPDYGLSGAITLQVRVTDAGAAEAQLLRLVLDDPQTTVIAFGRTQHNLEETFLQIVEGGNTHGNHS